MFVNGCFLFVLLLVFCLSAQNDRRIVPPPPPPPFPGQKLLDPPLKRSSSRPGSRSGTRSRSCYWFSNAGSTTGSNRPYALTSRLHNNDAMLGVKTCRAARTCCAGRALALSASQSVRGPGGMACRGWPPGCMLGDGARNSASFDPQHPGAPFCDVICIRSIEFLLVVIKVIIDSDFPWFFQPLTPKLHVATATLRERSNQLSGLQRELDKGTTSHHSQDAMLHRERVMNCSFYITWK